MVELLDEVPARALAIYAHPDDPEVSCGGTLARWADAGAEITLLIATRGEKGATDPGTEVEALAAQRADEVAAAAEVLGVAVHAGLGYPDGELDNTAALRRELVARIRALRPDVVLAPDPTAVFFGTGYVNHRDHRELGWAVLDACCPAAASPLYHPDAGPPHRVATLLLSGTLEPDVWVDIGATVQTKTTALGCHRSQLGHDRGLVGEVVRQRAADAGRSAGVDHAEGYRRLILG
ncbi:PIG-L family deacetylase [soil metagenome]